MEIQYFHYELPWWIFIFQQTLKTHNSYTINDGVECLWIFDNQQICRSWSSYFFKFYIKFVKEINSISNFVKTAQNWKTHDTVIWIEELIKYQTGIHPIWYYGRFILVFSLFAVCNYTIHTSQSSAVSIATHPIHLPNFGLAHIWKIFER